MTTCRQGHESVDSDYCSVCGMAIAPAVPSTAAGGAAVASGGIAGAPAPAAAGAAALAGLCPACGEARTDPAARFCEVCRFDFVSGVQGPPPVAAPQAPAAQPASPAAQGGVGAAPATPGTDAGTRWEVTVTVDPTLDDEPDPSKPCPTDEPERIFLLDLAETLIGRRDDRRDIHPEIPLHDPGASRRHAKLLRQTDGSVLLLDLASANGTRLNGTPVEAGVPHTLNDGDAITLGRWTRITLRHRP
jgi:hypothetical protein